MEPPCVRGRTVRSAWGYIHHVNKPIVIDVPMAGYVSLRTMTKSCSLHGPAPERRATQFIPTRDVRVAPPYTPGHDLAHVAAPPDRHRDDPSDHVLRGPAPVVPLPAGWFRQTRGGEAAGRAQTLSLI